MLDVPRHRGVPSVTHDRPVHGWELDDILAARAASRSSRATRSCVYCGREAWQAQDPEQPYGAAVRPRPAHRPGLHVSCLPFLRDHDVSVLVWDMLDHLPIGYDIPWAVHACLFAYGCALVDNALLEPLAQACVEEQRDEFMLIVVAAAGGGRHRLAGESARGVLSRPCYPSHSRPVGRRATLAYPGSLRSPGPQDDAHFGPFSTVS